MLHFCCIHELIPLRIGKTGISERKWAVSHHLLGYFPNHYTSVPLFSAIRATLLSLPKRDAKEKLNTHPADAEGDTGAAAH